MSITTLVSRATRLRHGWRWIRIAAGWIPLTPLSVAGVLLLRWLYYAFGVERHDYILLALSLCGLGLIGLSVLLVTASALWLRLRRQPKPGERWELQAGIPFQTGYTLGWAAFNPLVRIELAWDQPRGVRIELVRHRGRVVEQITPLERGEQKHIIRRITVRDVLGLSRLSFRRRLGQEITINPAILPADRLPVLHQNMAGDAMEEPTGKPEGDLIEMRPYVPGDPLKLVLWKIYARTGRMLVRLPERACAPCEKTLAYFVAGEADEPAAGMVRTALERGGLGKGFVFAADGTEEPARTTHDAVAAVVRSANYRDCGGEGLGRFLAHGDAQGLRACVLFVPPRPGAWLGRVVEQIAGHAGPWRAVVGVDEIEPERKLRHIRRLLVRGSRATAVRAAEMEKVRQTLSNAGVEVVIHWGRGELV